MRCVGWNVRYSTGATDVDIARYRYDPDVEPARLLAGGVGSVGHLVFVECGQSFCYYYYCFFSTRGRLFGGHAVNDFGKDGGV